MINTDARVSEVRLRLRAMASAETAAVLQRYFKTAVGEYGEGDLFLGIKVPPVRALAREFGGLGEGEVLELLRSRHHEERLLALMVMVRQYAKADAAGRRRLHGVYLANTRFVNNWDLVDSSAEVLVGAHLEGRSVALLRRLTRSKIVWERRIAMIATMHFIKRREFAPTLEIAELLLGDGHDLIHKAAGWMLREVGKKDQTALEGFLRRHCKTMPRTMLRYAIERFPERLRRGYLDGTWAVPRGRGVV
jgi:3-methyladenine DNA glycosylase AlkD